MSESQFLLSMSFRMVCAVFLAFFDFNTKQPNKSAWWTLVVAGHLVPLQL